MATGTMDDKTSTTQMLLNTQLKNSTQTITLSTAKKYVKKDIKIDITTQAAQTAAGVAVGDTVIYTDTSDTDINPNLVSGLFSCTVTNSTFSKSGNVTFTLTADQLKALAGKTLIFSYDYSIEGSRTKGTSSAAGGAFGIRGFFKYTKIGASSITMLAPFSNAIAKSGTGKAIMEWVVPTDIETINSNLEFQIQCGSADYAKPSTSGITWYIKNVKLEEGTEATAWVPNSADTRIINLGSKVTLASGPSGKYYIPLKTTGSGYTEVTQKGWIEEGNKDKAEVINTNYINIPEATFQNITVTTNTSKVQLVSAEGYTEGKYINALTVPAKKTLDTLTLTAGDSSERTYLSTLNVNNYTTVNSISLKGIITTITADGGCIETANLNNTNSYIGNVYGIGYIGTNSGNTLAKYTQNGTLTTYEGSGGILNYSNTGTITRMTGSRTITNLGTSSTAGTLNITSNTYGTINVWGGKTKDKGVTIANHVVTVDGDGTKAGTTVTNSSGDLITTSLSFSGGTPSITGNSNSIAVTGMATSDTATNYYIKATAKAKATRAAVNYTNATAGWLSAHASATQASAQVTSDESSFDSAITYIKEASASVTASVGPKPTIANLTSVVSGKTQISAAPSTDANTISTYYIAVRANSPATAITFTRQVDQAGYLSSNTQISGSSNSTSTNGDTYYIPLKSGVLANSATTNVTYTENTSVAIPSQGALYINAGYYPDTMITLDQMLDGKTDTAGTAAGQILSGYVAYDVDGKKLTGTMPNRNNYTVNADDMIGHDPGKVWVRYPYGYYAATSAKADCSYLYVPDSYFGNATAAQVLSGSTFTSSAGYKVTGTIPTDTAPQITTKDDILSNGDDTKYNFYFPQKYYTSVSTKTEQLGKNYLQVTKTVFGDAAASEVLSGKTFTSSNGVKISGTIPVIDGDKQDALSVGWSSLSTKLGKLYIGIPGDAYYKKAGSAAYIYVSPSQLPQAVFASNITTASSGGVSLVSTAGYTEINNLTAVTIAAGETLGSASAAGVTLSAKDTDNNISQMYVTMNTGSKIYLKDANSGKTWIIESDSINNSLNIWQE